MAIYQAPRKRWRLAVVSGVIGVLAGLMVGFAFSGSGPDPLAAIRELDRQLEEAAAPLDVLVIHSEAETSSAADARVVTDALARTQQRFAEVRDVVEAIDPDAIEDFERHTEELRELAQDGADADAIAAEAEELAQLLRGIVSA
jgi:hypothetical protein